MSENNSRVWNPRGGEIVTAPMLVDIEEVVGVELSTFERPDSGNTAAKKAMRDLSLDFIAGSPIDQRKLDALGRALSQSEAIPSPE